MDAGPHRPAPSERVMKNDPKIEPLAADLEEVSPLTLADSSEGSTLPVASKPNQGKAKSPDASSASQ